MPKSSAATLELRETIDMPKTPDTADTRGARDTQGGPERSGPLELRYLAFDFGLKKIGVALGDTLLRQARPLCVIESEVKAQRFAAIEQLLTTWEPDQLVVGLPLTVTGEEQLASRQARRFANQLTGRFDLPVVLVEEQYSSMEAQSIIDQLKAIDPKRARAIGAHDDAVAAAVILQRHLDQGALGAME